MDKKQFDEVLINAIYLLGGSNSTPFDDIIFFEEEKDIDDELYHKTMDSLDCVNDWSTLDEYDDDDDIDDDLYDMDDVIRNVESRINIDKIVKNIMDKLSESKEKPDTTVEIPPDISVISLDKNVYKDLDVNKFDLTIGTFKKISNEDIKKIADLENDINEMNIEMLDNIKMNIKDKERYYSIHKRKNKIIEDLYNDICDRKTEEIEKTMNDFCEYVINSKYCNSKPSVITLVASSTVYIRNIMIGELDDLFKSLIFKAGKDSDIIFTLVDLL